MTINRANQTWPEDVTEAIMRCNQCEALMINGVFCHETGCPNTRSRFDEQSGEWIKQYKCFTCGCDADVDSNCCAEEFEDESEMEFERRQRG